MWKAKFVKQSSPHGHLEISIIMYTFQRTPPILRLIYIAISCVVDFIPSKEGLSDGFFREKDVNFKPMEECSP
jgi:hypothetical protein